MNLEGSARTILVFEDEPEVRGYLTITLKCLGYAVEFAHDGDDALSCLETFRNEIDAVLLDTLSPNRDGIDTLREIHAMDPGLPVIVLTGGRYGHADVVNAMKCGATDFLSKPVAFEDLKIALDRAVASRVSTAAAIPQPALPKTSSFVGTAPTIREVQALAKRVGWSEAPVLIQGETGSGKEVLARELHALSPRSNKPFVKLNCAAVPSELLESELFGYEKGAFTGAFQKKTGMFELANGGTMLLDEIGDMDIRLQAKLLQVLQDQEFHRIGGKETIRVDVRIIAATHQNLEKAIEDNRFREDLFYRLSVINLSLPPLRERQEDIVPLAQFFWKKHSGPGSLQMPANLKQVFTTYHWPGNVRELENNVRKLIVLRDPELVARDLLARSRPSERATALAQRPTGLKVQAIGRPILEQVLKAKEQDEVDAILAALHAARWNRKHAARLLNINYKALLYKMKKLGIDETGLPLSSEVSTERARAANAGSD